ncbi:MAG: hypothetical protein ACE5FS_09685 [Paracoccaceae bacterium]
MTQAINLVAVAQAGRLQYEALLLAASLRAAGGEGVRLWLAEPQPGPEWDADPRIDDAELRAMLGDLGARIVPFRAPEFGARYPHGNKIVAPSVLPEGEPFVFLDTDTLVLAPLTGVPFDFARPTASLRREGTWPNPDVAGFGLERIWAALYRRFGLDFEASLDPAFPAHDWRRYLYFNAGFFFYRCPRVFSRTFREFALAIRDDPPPELAGQKLDPWLDQAALPLVIHALGGGRGTLPPGLMDGSVTCHYRAMPLLYARERREVIETLETVAAPNRIKKILKRHEPFRRFVYQGMGARAGALFDGRAAPANEAGYRKTLKSSGLWLR